MHDLVLFSSKFRGKICPVKYGTRYQIKNSLSGYGTKKEILIGNMGKFAFLIICFQRNYTLMTQLDRQNSRYFTKKLYEVIPD